jgi:hypothetical protein
MFNDDPPQAPAEKAPEEPNEDVQAPKFIYLSEGWDREKDPKEEIEKD